MHDIHFFFKFDDEIDIIRQKTVFFIIFSVNDYRVLYNNAVRPLIVRDMLGFRVMVFNATFNNISVISWRSVLLMEETEIPRENH